MTICILATTNATAYNLNHMVLFDSARPAFMRGNHDGYVTRRSPIHAEAHLN